METEQRYAIKFCVHLKKNTVETILLLQEAIGNRVLGVSTIKMWHNVPGWQSRRSSN